MAATTLTLVSVGLAVAAAGVSTYSAIQQSQAAEDAANYNAAVQRNQASAANAEATAEAAKSRDRTKRLLAAQRAQFAKSGGSLSGSALDVLYDSALQSELNTQTIQYRGARQATTYLDASRLHSMQAANARGSRGLVATGTILGGLGQAAGTYRSSNA